MDHKKRIDKTVSFVAVNIAILTVSDSRRLSDDKSGDWIFEALKDITNILFVVNLISFLSFKRIQV